MEDGDSDVVALCKKYGIDKKKVKALYMQYVSGKGDDFTTVIFLQPAHDNGGIQAAGVGKHDFFD